MNRRLGWFAAVIAALVLAIALAFLATGESPRGNSLSGSESGRASVTQHVPKRAVQDNAQAATRGPVEHASQRTLDAEERQRRAAVREQILAAQRARDAAARETGMPNARPSDADLQPQPKPELEPVPEAERPPGLVNHVEDRDELVAALNSEFLPLVDECIDDAIAGNPALAGMLTLEFEMVVDEDLGAVIDSVDFPPTAADQVVHAELQECARESLLSTLLPPGKASGREGLVVILKIGGEEQ
jgi:hypothetical protein